MLVAMNDFARRHTAESPYSYFSGTESELISLVTAAIEDGKTRPAFRPGVAYVRVPPEGFLTGVVKLTEDTSLRSEYKARREGEEPMISTYARGEKTPATFVEILVYSHEALMEDDDASTDAEWEIVSINASPVENEPQNPVSMMRNQLGLAGGTLTEYPSYEWARAVQYHSTHAMVDPNPPTDYREVLGSLLGAIHSMVKGGSDAALIHELVKASADHHGINLDEGEHCPGCGAHHTQECIDGGRCVFCGTMLCAVVQ